MDPVRRSPGALLQLAWEAGDPGRGEPAVEGVLDPLDVLQGDVAEQRDLVGHRSRPRRSASSSRRRAISSAIRAGSSVASDWEFQRSKAGGKAAGSSSTDRSTAYLRPRPP